MLPHEHNTEKTYYPNISYGLYQRIHHTWAYTVCSTLTSTVFFLKMFVPFACNGCSSTHDLLLYTLQNSQILPKQVKLYSYLQNMKSWPFLNHSYDYKDTTAPNFNTWLPFTIPNNGAFCPLHLTWAGLPTVMGMWTVGIGMDHNQWLLHDPWLLPRRVPLSQITPIHLLVF